MTHRIAPRSGASFEMSAGQYLTVTDPEGEQVADLVAYARGDTREVISSGRSLDYAGKLWLSTGDHLYSNRSRKMLTIVADEVGRHDFTLTPCSADTFRILYGDDDPHHGCQGNLERALKRYGIGPDDIPVAFNIFMHVAFDPADGSISVQPPLSRAGQSIVFQAQLDLVVGLTACSAGQSNNFRFKPIDYLISDHMPDLAGTATDASRASGNP